MHFSIRMQNQSIIQSIDGQLIQCKNCYDSLQLKNKTNTTKQTQFKQKYKFIHFLFHSTNREKGNLAWSQRSFSIWSANRNNGTVGCGKEHTLEHFSRICVSKLHFACCAHFTYQPNVAQTQCTLPFFPTQWANKLNIILLFIFVLIVCIAVKLVSRAK